MDEFILGVKLSSNILFIIVYIIVLTITIIFTDTYMPTHDTILCLVLSSFILLSPIGLIYSPFNFSMQLIVLSIARTHVLYKGGRPSHLSTWFLVFMYVVISVTVFMVVLKRTSYVPSLF